MLDGKNTSRALLSFLKSQKVTQIVPDDSRQEWQATIP